MANDYYTRQGSYTQGTLARGDVVKSDFDALVTAWDTGQTNIKRALKLPNEGSPQTDFAITANAATRATKCLGFDTLGDLELQTGAGNWEGTWATSTAYELRDVIVDGAAGANTDNLYICVVAHTSGTWATDLSASKWELMINVAEAREWARKTTGIVDSTDYSAKAWAIGGTDVTDTASRGAAKEWAIETTGTVDTTSYSAKEYAQGTQASTGGSAKDYAQKIDGGVSGATSDHSSKAWAVGGTGVTTTASKGSSKEWATTTGGYVDTAEYSAKEYAVGTTVAGGSAKDWAMQATGTVDGSSYSAKYNADAAATSASASSTSASASSTSASASATSATASASSASASSTSATASAASATSAAASYDDFDDRELGSKSSDPALDNDGDALVDGAQYFNTTNNVKMVYDLATTTWLRTTPTTTDQAHINTVSGIAANVTTVSGISANVTTVAGISSDVSGVSAIAADVSGVNAIGGNVTTTASNSANITTVAGSIANVNATGGSIANVNTVAGSIADVNRYAAEYTISASAPGSPSEGDLWYDSVNDVLKYHNGTAFVGISGDTDVLVGVSVNDTTAGYLNGKLVGGTGITLTENNDGSNETLTITSADNSIPMAIALG